MLQTILRQPMFFNQLTAEISFSEIDVSAFNEVVRDVLDGELSAAPAGQTVAVGVAAALGRVDGFFCCSYSFTSLSVVSGANTTWYLHGFSGKNWRPLCTGSI